ncbi:aspartate-semialdehyde dehydrogenase [Candidatus Microgenomates bacterium]|nr:aspartate-semialdehyde dehydrogenase [Candidatus Microgenomates bacterium]
MGKGSKKLKVGILGATGMVGQRFVTLLDNHPWFEVTLLAASPRSSGKTYQEAVDGRWKIEETLPNSIKNLVVKRVVEDKEKIAREVDFVFCALDMDNGKTKEIELWYAKNDIPVISTNSAHRWSEDVPMIIPEINPQHLALIDKQRQNHGWKRGFIAVKPNCSLQSYLPLIWALGEFEPKEVSVTTMQAVSGAGKTLSDWPEMTENVIPFINGEEEKTEQEPLKILGRLKNGHISQAQYPRISATCIRVPVSDGHLAAVAVSFKKKPTRTQILSSVKNAANPLQKWHLPSAPNPFIYYFGDDNRPQTRLDRDFGRGMGITFGRLREDKQFDWKFVALSHNTIRGAAGGAVLTAELLKAKGYL